MLRNQYAVVLTVSLMLLSACAWAQQAPTGATYDVKDVPLQQVLTQIGKSLGVTVLAESSVKAKVTGQVENLPLEKALDGLCKPQRLVWRQLFVPKAQPVYADRLSETVRALKELEVMGIFIADPATRKGTSLLRNFPLQEGYEAQMMGENSGFKPVYLVLHEKPPKAAARKDEKGDGKDEKTSRVDRYNQLAQEQMNVLLQMSPEEQMEAMQAGMKMFMNMDPQMRQQMMQTGMRMGMEMMQQMDPETQRMMIEQGIQMMQQVYGNQIPPK
ncbi:MAG: hypothetical protein IT210_08695 [Armatimonadetes bacterium]|nr:hypothetical protein [Armatimonadota bacterium]